LAFLAGVEDYAAARTSPLADPLALLEMETRSEFPEWCDIMVSPLQAKFLEFLVAASGARRVLEVGTFTGLSTLALARVLAQDGSVLTCDNFGVEAEAETMFRRAVKASPHGHKVELVVGDAIDVLAEVEGPFDVIFLDADKPNYISYYERILARGLLAADGTIAVDNVLWGGKAATPPTQVADWVDEWALAVREFSRHVHEDPRVEQVMLTVRDGITLIRHSRGPDEVI
jgi:caffeoyl-CoA O-methyltransferase